MVLERCTNAVATPFGVTGALVLKDAILCSFSVKVSDKKHMRSFSTAVNLQALVFLSRVLFT